MSSPMAEGTIQAVYSIDALAFSNLVEMKDCLLKGLPYKALAFNEPSQSSPRSKSQIIGDLTHDLLSEVPKFRKLERHQRLQALNERLDTLLVKAKSKYQHSLCCALHGPIDRWIEIQKLLTHASQIIRAPQSNDKSFVVDCERMIYSQDKRLFGKPDVTLRTDSYSAIIEHKSGKLTDDGKLKTRYVEQLNFYSMLFKENFGKWPNELILKSTIQDEIRLKPNPVLSKKLQRDALVLIELVNHKVKRADPVAEYCSTSATACGNCSRQYVCPLYQSALGTFHTQGKIHSFIGSIGEVISSPKTRRVTLKIELERGTLSKSSLAINDFYPEFFDIDQPEVGQRLLFLHVWVDSTTKTGRLLDTSIVREAK